MRSESLRRLTELADGADGVFTAGQAVRAGVSRSTIRRGAAAGLLERVHPEVWRFRAAPATDRQQIRAAVLQVGRDARASHEAALRLHGVDRIPPVLSVMVGPTGNHRHAGLRVHRMGDLHHEHVIELDGIPTTTLARAVIDVNSTFSRLRMTDLLDRLVIIERRVTVAQLLRVGRQVTRNGRRNIRRLAAELDRRAADHPAPRSLVEREFDELVAASPLPAPLHEHPVPSAAPGAGLSDRVWPEALLIVEIDGRGWHARERAMARDRARDRESGRLGWLTMRVLDEEVRGVPDLVLDDIVTVHRRRLGQLGR